MTVADAHERERAVDPLHSFCVSAPAGSGKTELLIQRYLALLSRVDRPEQVLAITFTRKAAAEMRERVIAALREARLETPCVSPHQERTRELALDALRAEAAKGWHLERDSSRLNIRTIDGFCASLTRQMPILSEFGGQARVVESATELYAEAVTELFAMLETDHPVGPDLGALMLHFDNNWERLQELLVTMLAQRDQWRDYIGLHRASEEAERYLLQSVRALLEETLMRLRESLRPHLDEILALLRYAGDNLGQPLASHFPGSAPGDLPLWRRIRAMLLTGGGEWRKRITVAEGFPAGKGEAAAWKARLTGLIDTLQAVEGLGETLAGLDLLPDPGADSASWRLVLHLSHVLPHLAAQLLLVFARHGKVDHNQVALSALQALGEDDAPTELALRLDYQIEHILVDEFQDTAINQFELVRRLTRGWGEYNAANPTAPRTLLIVGDAMQSIYGFRDANVGLFLKARQSGFNGVIPVHLRLLCNFRSDKGAVDWVNDTFGKAFPAVEDIGKGQVSFTPAVAVRPARPGQAIEMHGFVGDDAGAEEAAFICAEVARGSADPDVGTIAVLGRTRGHLQPILAGLRRLGMDYSAQAMDSLADSPVIVDLVSLCRALYNPADRVAWMALLRAPWCGLTLDDLLVIGRRGAPARFTPVWSILNDAGALAALSADGRARVEHVRHALQWALARRDRLALRVWVEQLWLALGGEQTVAEQSQLQDAEGFFRLLEQAEEEAVGLDPAWLEARLLKLYADRERPGCKVQVMTLHKAKGLEFDWVLIPGLGRATRTQTRQLLLADDYTTAAGQRGFLLAADDHSEPGSPGLYNFLRSRQKQKEILEATRLLYVGATRAIRRLVLSAELRPEPGNKGPWREPAAGSLLRRIWPAFRQQAVLHDAVPAADPAQAPSGGTRLQRLSRLPPAPAGPVTNAMPAGPNIPERRFNRLERLTGTVVHQALEELSRRQELPPASDEQDRMRWRADLCHLGLHGAALETALEAVHTSVENALAENGPGRWILSPAHPWSRSEWALTRPDGEERTEDMVIDRTFLDAATGERWLIDYKTSRPESGESLERFLARESATYRPQMLRYRDTLHAIAPSPLRVALYFTTIGHLHRLQDLDLAD
ncbi:MAG: UvrD-helicase domain-containing protein [Halioglobus sp.]